MKTHKTKATLTSTDSGSTGRRGHHGHLLVYFAPGRTAELVKFLRMTEDDLFSLLLRFLLVYFCYKRKRHLETEGKDKDLSYAFVTNSFEVCYPSP